MVKFSIITPTFNSEKTILDTLKSVKKQKYNNYEHIIIDSSSNNLTLDIVKKFKNKKIKFFYLAEKGIYKALNMGIKQSVGDFIIFLNSDDYFFNCNVLKNLNYFINNNKNIKIFYADLVIISKKNKNKIVRNWISEKVNISLFSKGWFPPHPTFVVNKKTYLKYGLYDEKEDNLANDVELIMRYLGFYKITSKYINLKITKMRDGGISNKNFTNIIKQNLYIIHCLKKYQLFDGYFKYFLFKFLIRLKQYLR